MNNNIFYYFYNLGQNSEFVANFAILINNLTYPLIAFLFIWVVFSSKRKFNSFAILFLTAISTLLVARTWKFLFQINRPFVEFSLDPLILENGYSFPSEHTAVFFALTFVVFYLNKRLGWIFFILSVLVALSRIVLGVHYMSDIIGGLLLGCVISFLYIQLFKKLKI